MSTSLRDLELGVGALFADRKPGLIGYVSYSLGFLTGRLEMDWQQGTGFKGGVTLGLKVQKEGLKLEPHVFFPVADSTLHSPKWGFRLGVQFSGLRR